MTTRLATLMARHEELLVKCSRIDRAAARAREMRKPLSTKTRAGFKAHTELRVLEHEIAKLKESKK